MKRHSSHRSDEIAMRKLGFWTLHIPGWLLLIYLIYAQGIAAFSYDLGVKMGTQEPAETITAVGTAFWYGFAFGDLLFYIPILAIGLIGHMRRAAWGRVALAAAMGVTVYWPVVSLSALVAARGAEGWKVEETPYWVVCLSVTLWGLWSLGFLVQECRQAPATSSAESA